MVNWNTNKIYQPIVNDLSVKTDGTVHAAGSLNHKKVEI